MNTIPAGRSGVELIKSYLSPEGDEDLDFKALISLIEKWEPLFRHVLGCLGTISNRYDLPDDDTRYRPPTPCPTCAEARRALDEYT